MEHVPSGVYGVVAPHGHGGGAQTVIAFVVVGIVFYGGVWLILKAGDLLTWTADKVRRWADRIEP